MNIAQMTGDGLGKLRDYIILSVLLTAASIWILVALHNKHHHQDPNISFASRLQWPVRSLIKCMSRGRTRYQNPRGSV